MQNLKMEAAANPAEPPSRLVRDALSTVSLGVLSQLPERENLRKAIRRERRKNLPPNQQSLDELQDIPDQYRKTLQGERFLLMDNWNTADDDEGRVLVFATRKNIEMLCRSPIWFMDGTFKVSPTIFTHHPDLYSALIELQKEQGNTEVCMAELSLGRRVKNSPARKWVSLQDRIRSIVLEFDDYVNDETELEYLRTLAHTIMFI